MNEIRNSTCFENSCYITTANGDVWRIWFEGQSYPVMQQLLPQDAKDVNDWIEKKRFIRKQY